MRRFVVAAVVLGALVDRPERAGRDPDVFGGAVTCTLQGDNDRVCGNTSPRSTAPTFDGIPIDVNVAFPADDGVGPDGDYPLIMVFHGYGGSKFGFGGDGALPRPRLRGLQHDRPRLPRVLRHAPTRRPPAAPPATTATSA